jgi:hypothetical protein
MYYNFITIKGGFAMDTKICQCCGMPLDDESIISVEKDGSKNDEYCKWCYREWRGSRY